MFRPTCKRSCDGSSGRTLAALFVVVAFIFVSQTLHADVKPAFASEVKITIEDGVRIIRSNGIPNHLTGEFPNRGNPNTIAPQKYEFRMPADPRPAEHATPLRMQPFGVAINGVVFDPGAAEWWNRDRNSGWQYEPLFGSNKGALGTLLDQRGNDIDQAQLLTALLSAVSHAGHCAAAGVSSARWARLK